MLQETKIKGITPIAAWPSLACTKETFLYQEYSIRKFWQIELQSWHHKDVHFSGTTELFGELHTTLIVPLMGLVHKSAK